MIDLPLTPVSSNIDLPLAPVPSNKEPLPTVLDFGQEKLGLWLKDRINSSRNDFERVVIEEKEVARLLNTQW